MSIVLQKEKMWWAREKALTSKGGNNDRNNDRNTDSVYGGWWERQAYVIKQCICLCKRLSPDGGPWESAPGKAQLRLPLSFSIRPQTQETIGNQPCLHSTHPVYCSSTQRVLTQRPGYKSSENQHASCYESVKTIALCGKCQWRILHIKRCIISEHQLCLISA